jgi:MSHA type pilus biogenesis protein MshL
MKIFKTFFLILFCLWFTGCMNIPYSRRQDKREVQEESNEPLVNESQKLAKKQKELRDLLESSVEKDIDVEPVMPVYDPLKEHIVSFSMVNEDLKMVLYSLSRETGVNLIIDPAIETETKPMTLSFEKVPASTVLEEVLNTFDLYYTLEDNIIRVMPFQEHMFKLNFLDTTVNSSFSIGGDVLGGGDTEVNTGLDGNFKLSGEGSKMSNPYDALEAMVKQVISEKGKGGKYSMNRMSGSLYVKDTPSTIRAISKLVTHFKQMMSRQILIEARIIEVILDDDYEYGVDWSVLRGDVDEAEDLKGVEIDRAKWSLGEGLSLSSINNDFAFNIIVNALNAFGEAKVISNPTLRSKHGKPSLISVGTSFSYKKSQTQEDRDFGNDIRIETEIEISTVFDGLILGVIPFIEEDGRISLLVNPIKSDVDKESLQLVLVGPGQSLSLPEVNIKEISTTIMLNDKDVVILGGLIDKRKANSTKGFPFLSSIPVLGYLFKNEFQTDQIRELVIVLSVTII